MGREITRVERRRLCHVSTNVRLQWRRRQTTDTHATHAIPCVCVCVVHNDDDDRNDLNPVPLAHIALYLCVEHLVFFVPFIFNICFLCSAHAVV